VRRQPVTSLAAGLWHSAAHMNSGRDTRDGRVPNCRHVVKMLRMRSLFTPPLVALCDQGLNLDELERPASLAPRPNAKRGMQLTVSRTAVNAVRRWQALRSYGNRDGVFVRLPRVFCCRLRCVICAGGRGCWRCGRACAGWPGSGTRRRGGLRVWRAGSGFRRRRSSAPSSAPDLDDRAVWPRVRVVHPFHPWAGREFEFVQRRRTWDVDRVFFRVPGAGVMSLPAGWVLPGAQDPHLDGVQDADEEPGISGGVVGQVPSHVGEVPESRQIFGGGCCVRACGSRERRGRLSLPGPWSAAGRGSAR